MERKVYFWTAINNYLKKMKKKEKININIQKLYNKYGYGYNDTNDAQLLMELQKHNMLQNDIYFATGQSGYFNEQIMSGGLGSSKLNAQDIEDARFISNCFGKNTMYSDNNIPIIYITLLGTTEFNYGIQTFPAGIFEDVFQCNENHAFPIQPIVGENEQDFYLRLLEFQIDSFDKFNPMYKQEALARGKRLIHNFCCKNNRIYLIKLSDIENIKASFGDVKGLRDGKATFEESQQIIRDLPSFCQLMNLFRIDSDMIYNDPNMQSEYGIALYDIISPEKLQFIEVESKYKMMQRRAIELGYSRGDIIPVDFSIDINCPIKK